MRHGCVQSRTSPLTEALAELNRGAGFQRIVLRGLDADEVRSFMAATTGREPAADFVARVFEETEGNPFFLGEIVNLLTEEGRLDDSVSDIPLPDGVREALGRRLDRLSAEANELLAVASVVGREFAYGTLAVMREYGADELLRLLEEGLDARVLKELEQPGRFRFTHALMQETLLYELTTTRRVRLHGEVAEALVRQYGDRATERAARIVHHYAESAAMHRDHAEHAVRYSLLAGEQAEARLGWADAVRHYQRAVVLLDDRSDIRGQVDHAALLTALGVSASNAAETRIAWRVLMRAIDEYREPGDAIGQARATLPALTGFVPPDRPQAARRCVELSSQLELRPR